MAAAEGFIAGTKAPKKPKLTRLKLWLNMLPQVPDLQQAEDSFGPPTHSRRKAAPSIFALLLRTWRDRASRRAYIVVGLCYAAMLADFFIFNQPVNEALTAWTVSSLPADWSQYRLRWEIGHALTALFSVIAFAALIRQRSFARRGHDV